MKFLTRVILILVFWWGWLLLMHPSPVMAQTDLGEIVTFGDLLKTPPILPPPVLTFASLLEPKVEAKTTVILSAKADLDQYLVIYGQQYGVDSDWLKRIAYCESSLNPQATNDIYAGLFQFSPTTWQATRRRMKADPDTDLRFEAEEAIKTAAFKISQDGAGAWPVCQWR